jgi:exopolysaccharide biosynthesis polyprenyl glycosylphosphotransferase
MNLAAPQAAPFVERRAPRAPLREVRHETTGSPAVAHRDRIFRRALALADVYAVLGAVLVSVYLAGGTALRPTALLAAPAIVVLAKLLGLYDREELVMRKSTLEEGGSLLKLASVFVLAAWFGQEALSREPLARGHGAVMWLVLLALLLSGRSLARALARVAAPSERLLLVGDRDARRRLEQKLGADPHAVACIVAELPLAERRGAAAAAPPWDALDWAVEQHGVHRVIVAPGDTDSETTVQLVSRAKSLGVNVTIMPRLAEVVGSSVAFDHLDGIPMLGVRRFGLSRSSWAVKRAVDVAGALFGLLVLAPVLAALAAAVKLDSRGPVLYRQVRVGREGRRFTMLKFRSMVDGAHAQREALREQAGGDGLFKLAEDPRVTRVGRFIRRTSLDELPQLINVLRGEMSLVGPRPLVVDEDQRVMGWHRRRLHITPGMTGPWQVMGSGRQRVPLRDMLTIDYLYVANWSLWIDVQILLRTVGHVLLRRGV